MTWDVKLYYTIPYHTLFEIFDFKYAMTLKTGLGPIKVSNVTS